jgi:predicted nucleic acid-binding protein
MLFFDTSALVKRYADEQGTAAVDELIENDDEAIVITSLSVIEMTSAFRRKFNRGEITETQRDGLLVAFFEEATDTFTIVPIDETAYEIAFDLVLEDDLRTLDALQLGAARELVTTDLDMTFVCADRDLVSIAEIHNMATVNPATK